MSKSRYTFRRELEINPDASFFAQMVEVSARVAMKATHPLTINLNRIQLFVAFVTRVLQVTERATGIA
jgi:hypothetical protein